jgi:hypothetical protein
MKILIALALFVSLIGCAKKEVIADDPSAPVMSFFKSATAGDSAGVMNSFASTLREQFLSEKDTAKNMRQILKNWKGTHADVKVKEVKIDSASPNLAKIYIRAVYTGDKPLPPSDSIFFYVAKEDNEWRLSSLIPHRDKP